MKSNCENSRKFPDPFPEWSIATSAFWNLVWAVKYDKRGKLEIAGEYLNAACDKLDIDGMRFSRYSVDALLAILAEKDDVDAGNNHFEVTLGTVLAGVYRN